MKIDIHININFNDIFKLFSKFIFRFYFSECCRRLQLHNNTSPAGRAAAAASREGGAASEVKKNKQEEVAEAAGWP